MHSESEMKILMPSFMNATNDDHAGSALTEMTATALFERGIPLYQTEESRSLTGQGSASSGIEVYAELAARVGATHLLMGTVHEYRYKTDLDGDPAVGITLRLVDVKDGLTVWQGSSGNVGYAFASLTSASSKATRSLVARIPTQETQ